MKAPTTDLRRCVIALMLSACMALTFAPAACLAVDWINTSNPAMTAWYDVPGNWLGGVVPGPADDIRFKSAGTYEVWWDSMTVDTTSANLSVSTGDVTFRRNGGTGPYTHIATGDASVAGGVLTLGTPGNSHNLNVGGALTVQDWGYFYARYGSDVVADSLQLANVPGGASVIRITGIGSTLDVDNGSSLGGAAYGSIWFENASTGNEMRGLTRLSSDGSAGESHLTVSGGSTLSLHTTYLATDGLADQIASISVHGTGSEITQPYASTLTIGAAANSSAEINVYDSGTFTSGGFTTTVNATGAINVDGGTFNESRRLELVGGALNVIGGGAFTLAGGRTLVASDGATVNFEDSHSINNSNTFDIQSGSNLVVGGQLTVGNATDGTLVVDGPGTTLTTGDGGTSIWGFSGASANITVRNEAFADWEGFVLLIAVLSPPSALGTSRAAQWSLRMTLTLPP